MSPRRRRCVAGAVWFAGAAVLVLLTPAPAEAYVGPGAGFVLLSSILTFVATIFVAILTLILWPFRRVWRMFRPWRRGPAFARRLIVVGLEGLDPDVTQRFMAKGFLPRLTTLAEIGGYRRLRTAPQPVSEASWSALSTGAELERDKASKPFWSVLGEHGIWSTILRVPTSLPPGRFHGAQLAATSVPDPRGPQRLFTLFTTRPSAAASTNPGRRIPIEVKNDRITCELPGPEGPSDTSMKLRKAILTIDLNREKGEATAVLSGTRVILQPGRPSDWIAVTFRAAPAVQRSGICRLLLLEMEEHVSLYVTPINSDPDKPAAQLAHPRYYAAYLAKRIGKFGTLGVAEDLAALNAGVIGAGDFVRQAYDSDREREAMYFAAFDRLRSGVLVCVFDGTDRMRRAFRNDAAGIEEMYRRNDALIGRIMALLGPDDVLLVLSSDGVLFSNRKIDRTDPGLLDVAPTVLRTFGVSPPQSMKGASLFDFAAGSAARGVSA